VSGIIKALIMAPPEGASPAEQWVAGGRNSAAADLINLLRSLDPSIEIHVLAAESANRESYKGLAVDSFKFSRKSFQFGEAIVEFAKDEDPGTLMYFGAGSAPLLSKATLEKSIEKIKNSVNKCAVVNNFHSTDWAILNSTSSIEPLTHRLPSDNQLGWVLRTEGGFQVDELPFSAETRVDIDTPTDLMMLSFHSGLGSRTREYLSANRSSVDERINEIRQILLEQAKTLTLIGRSSSIVWRALEKQTQNWIRVFVEERGMVASGRLQNKQVRSLLAEVVDELGIETMVGMLTSICDGVLWDTRVWMAHKKSWPSRADRFAADLGWVDDIRDNHLRDFTETIIKAPIPITTGGHGVVSGGVLALLESVNDAALTSPR